MSTAAFGFVTVENAAKLFPAHAVAAAAMMVVVLDCVMTFFGSTANDAAFNAYITDAVSEADRGKTESVLAILPLISMLVIFGAFDGMTQRGEWRKFFAIFGGLVTLTGLVGCFLIEEPKLQPRKEPYLRNLVYGLRPSVVRAHPALYLALAAFCVFSVAVQTFFPYLIIYIQNYLKIEGYAIVLGVVLIVASAVSVLFGRVIDRVGPLRFTLPAALVMFAGLIGMFFARGMLTVILAGCVMMSGYMLVTAALSGEIRDRTPEGKAGHFQGIRMIFGVLLPMILGPALGAAVIRNSDSTYVELGVVKTVPTPGIFLAAMTVLDGELRFDGPCNLDSAFSCCKRSYSAREMVTISSGLLGCISLFSMQILYHRMRQKASVFNGFHPFFLLRQWSIPLPGGGLSAAQFLDLP